MSHIYAFLFCLGLGAGGRVLYILATALAKRTDILPVTVALDFLTVAAVGGALTVYVIATATVIAPYMFAALFAGYFFTYLATKRKPEKARKMRDRRQKK